MNRTKGAAIGARALLWAALGMTMMTPALADPPVEDILYPGGPERSTPGGAFYLQLDLGGNQSELYGASGIHSDLGETGSVPGYLKSSNGTAPFIAATLGYQVAPSFSVGLRFDYDMRSASNSGNALSTCVDYDELGQPVGTRPITLRDRYEVNASYFGVALLPTLHVSDFFFFGGPSYSVPLSKDLRQTVSIGEDDGECRFFYGTDEAATSVSGRLSGSDNLKERTALKFGAGYTADLGSSTKLVLQAGYDLSMSDVFEEDDVMMLRNTESAGTHQEPVLMGSKVRFNSLQGSVGIRVNL